ncbi:MAG: SirB1 family protein [Acidobacteriota bacterium]
MARPLQPVPRLSRFSHLVTRPSHDVPLAEASLEISRDEHPDLDVASYLARLDELAEMARDRIPGGGSPRKRLEALGRFLGREQDFRGDEARLDKPDNAYLDRTLDRRRGLPVTLSVIYLSLARRLHLHLAGVSMPLRFIVRLVGEDPALFIDPFNRGEVLDRDGCSRLLLEISRGEMDLQPEFLIPVSSRMVLHRILYDLKLVHLRRRDPRRARKVVDLILTLHPDAAGELRDRGMLAYSCLLFGEAVADLEQYLEMAPHSKDATAIRARLASLRRLLPSGN